MNTNILIWCGSFGNIITSTKSILFKERLMEYSQRWFYFTDGILLKFIFENKKFVQSFLVEYSQYLALCWCLKLKELSLAAYEQALEWNDL